MARHNRSTRRQQQRKRGKTWSMAFIVSRNLDRLMPPDGLASVRTDGSLGRVHTRNIPPRALGR
jgi:hypothetical protein